MMESLRRWDDSADERGLVAEVAEAICTKK